MPVKVDNLNSSKILILQTLAALPPKGVGLTSAEIEKASGARCVTYNLGPMYKESFTGGGVSLHELGLVRCDLYEGDTAPYWKATAAGRKVAERFRGKRRNTGWKIPNDLIDAAVNQVRKTRPYGYEWYTEDDLKEVRELLGVNYFDVPLEEVREQITTRRKNGAFSDPSAKKKRLAAQVIRHFGPDGDYAKVLTKEQVLLLRRL